MLGFDYAANFPSETNLPYLPLNFMTVVAEGQDTGFRPRCEAWDEFVYGSHVVLLQGSGLSDSRPRQRVSHVPKQFGGDGDAGGPMLSPYFARW